MLRIQSMALATVIGAGSIFGAVGCTERQQGPAHTPPNTMTNDDMVAKGDAMIAEGKKMKDTAATMTDDEKRMGMTKSEMAKKGQKMIDDGQEMKTKAVSQKM